MKKITFERLWKISRSREPRFHGNGFVQVYLSPCRRLHIWHPDLPPLAHAGGIHDHQFAFKSSILLGEIYQSLYEVTAADEAEHGFYEVFCGHGNTGGPFQFQRPEPVLLSDCRTRLVESSVFVRGDAYELGLGKFHETRTLAGRITMTFLEKTEERRDYSPKVVRSHVDGPLGNAFDHAIEKRRIWTAIKDACDELRASTG